MKHILTSLLCIYLSSSAISQQLDWAFKIASNSGDRGMRITTDKTGDVITTGYFGEPADFDPSAVTQTLSPWGSSFADIYVAKYDAAGAYKWAIKIGTSSWDYVYGLATDTSGNIYVTGDFDGTIYFNGSFAVGTYFSSSSSRDGFLAKYDKDGNFKWAVKIGNTGKDVAYGVTTDINQNVYVTGYFGNTADFDPSASTANLTSNGGRDVFLAKYDASGNYKWAFNVGGPISTAYEEGGQDLVIKGANIYLTGNFEGTGVDFNPAAGTTNALSSNGSLDIFLAKYDTSMNYVWAISAGSAAKHDFSYGIDLDVAENVYITGGFEETVDFDPSGSVANLTSASVMAHDVFVAKYNSSGTYQWAFQIGGNSAVDDDGHDIAVNAAGDIFVAGGFWGPADFDPSIGFSIIGPSNNQIFIAKYDASRNLKWAFDVGSTSGTGPADNAFGIHAKDDGTFYVTGDFYGNATDFDPSPAVYPLAGDNTGHIFIASYDGNIVVSGINTIDVSSGSLESFPNPSDGNTSIRFTIKEESTVNLLITDISGRIIANPVNEKLIPGEHTVNLNSFSSGIYLCSLQTDKFIETVRVVVVRN